MVTVINHCIQTAFNLEKNALSRAQTYTCTTYLALLLIKTSLKDKSFSNTCKKEFRRGSCKVIDTT